MESISNAKRPTVDLGTGNIIDDVWRSWSYINQNGEKVSGEYNIIEPISDYFAIPSDSKDYDNIHYIVGRYDKSSKYLGIVAVKRDENGLIIPNSDTLVVPYLYNRIEFGGLKTVIASIPVNGYRQYTYVDLDPNHKSYGKQLVPMRLTEASAFKECDNEFEGFAKCRYKGKVGYISRNMRPIYEDIPSHMLEKLMVDELSIPSPNIDNIINTAIMLHKIKEQYGDFDEVLKTELVLKEMGLGIEKDNSNNYTKKKNN